MPRPFLRTSINFKDKAFFQEQPKLSTHINSKKKRSFRNSASVRKQQMRIKVYNLFHICRLHFRLIVRRRNRTHFSPLETHTFAEEKPPKKPRPFFRCFSLPALKNDNFVSFRRSIKQPPPKFALKQGQKSLLCLSSITFHIKSKTRFKSAFLRKICFVTLLCLLCFKKRLIFPVFLSFLFRRGEADFSLGAALHSFKNRLVTVVGH